MSAGRTLRVFTYDGDPNGHMLAPARGYLCVDYATPPGVWQSQDQGKTHWLQLGASSEGLWLYQEGAAEATSPHKPPFTAPTINEQVGTRIRLTGSTGVFLTGPGIYMVRFAIALTVNTTTAPADVAWIAGWDTRVRTGALYATTVLTTWSHLPTAGVSHFRQLGCERTGLLYLSGSATTHLWLQPSLSFTVLTNDEPVTARYASLAVVLIP